MKYLNLKALSICLLSLALILISSCADDGISDGNQQLLILPQSQELVNATISGRILDESGVNIEGAKVTLLSGLAPLEVLTDEYGLFTMPDVDSKGGAAYLSVTFPGKFEGFRKMSVVPRQYNYTEIKMLDKSIIGTIDATSGGSLSQSNGSAISLPKDGIIDAQNQVYNGQVEVAMSWIDPSAEDLAQRMIGDLSGINEDGVFQSLGSFGMLQVELYDGNGNELNIAPGEEAELTFPIPTSLRDDAASSIPLWSYNEEIGTWVQEGRAVREGNAYIGTVSHFSSWNVDVMVDPIAIEGTVTVSSEGGVELGASYLQVYVCSEIFGRKGGWLCDDGSFRFYNFPKGEKFQLKILDSCGDELYVETYGPFEGDENLGNISVGVISEVIRVKGNAIDCSGMPLADATLGVIQNDRRLKFPISDEGEFDFNLDVCSGSDATLKVVNLDELLEEAVAIPGDQTLVEFNDLKVCDDLEDFVSVTIDGGETFVYAPFVQLEIQSKEVDGVLCDAVGIFFVEESADSILTAQGLLWMGFGVNPANLEIKNGPWIAFGTSDFSCTRNEDVTGMATVELEEYGKNVGDIVKGTFRIEQVQCEDLPTGVIETNIIEGSFSIPVR